MIKKKTAHKNGNLGFQKPKTFLFGFFPPFLPSPPPHFLVENGEKGEGIHENKHFLFFTFQKNMKNSAKIFKQFYFPIFLKKIHHIFSTSSIHKVCKPGHSGWFMGENSVISESEGTVVSHGTSHPLMGFL